MSSDSIKQKRLRKTLNTGRSISLVLGSVLGSGLMILPGLAYNQVGIFSFYSWLGVGLLIVPFLYVFFKIMIKYPSAGGLVNVVNMQLGNTFGLWITYLTIFSLILLVPIVGLIGANYVCYLLKINTTANIFIAWLLLCFFTIVNTFDTRISLKIQGSASILLLLFLFIIIFISLYGAGDEFFSRITKPFNSYSDLQQIWAGMTIVFWAFLGWENLSFTTEEFKNVKRDLKRVISLSFFIMMVLYLGLSAGVIIWLDPFNPYTVSAPLAEVINATLGNKSAAAAAIIAILIMLININAWIWGPSRLLYDAGRKRIVPYKLADLNLHNTPYYALYILLLFYTISLLLIYFLGDKFLLIAIKQVNCIFIILYLLTVVSYYKISNSIYNKVVALFSIGLLILFLLYFGVYIILPLFFFVLTLIKFNILQRNYQESNTI